LIEPFYIRDRRTVKDISIEATVAVAEAAKAGFSD
jgi:hypothetical protein